MTNNTNLNIDLAIDTLENKKDELIKLTRHYVYLLMNTYVPFTNELTETREVNVGKFESLFNDVYKSYMLINDKVKEIFYIANKEVGLIEHAEVTPIIELVNLYDKVAFGVYSDLVDLATVIMNNDSSNSEITMKCLELRHVIDCFVVMKDLAR